MLSSKYFLSSNAKATFNKNNEDFLKISGIEYDSSSKISPRENDSFIKRNAFSLSPD